MNFGRQVVMVRTRSVEGADTAADEARLAAEGRGGRGFAGGPPKNLPINRASAAWIATPPVGASELADLALRPVEEAGMAEGAGVDDRGVAGGEIGGEMAGAGAEPEAMAAEAGGQDEALQPDGR